MPATSPKRCLVVTHLSLANLALKRNGIFQRLRMLIEAVQLAKFEVHIHCALAPSDLTGNLAESIDRIRLELMQHWAVSAHVTATIQKPHIRSVSTYLHRLASTLSYKHCYLVRSIMTDAALEELQRVVSNGHSLILAHRLPSMIALGSLKQPLPPACFDIDDLEHIATARASKHAPSLRNRLFKLATIPAIFLAEHTAIRRACKTLVCSVRDASHIRWFFRSERVHVVPNAMQLPEIGPGNTRQILLMVGSYKYWPNADGAEYFITRIFSRIRAELNDAEIWLVGPGDEHIPSRRNPPPGVRFMGFVPDLTEVYGVARVAVCPIRLGGGTRVKLIEAAAWGKAIVSTSIGAEGLDMQNGVHAAIADTPEDFAAECLRLLRDEARAAELGAAARILVEQRFDRKCVIGMLADEFEAMHTNQAGATRKYC